MDRRVRILSLCKKNGQGLEIGPSFNPIAPKREGYNVDILDHATAEELKAKYTGHGVDVSKIEPVDFVWKGQPIDELIGHAARYDWIIGSHVIEHLTDPVSFLIGCSKLLKPDGVLALAVPDKRYCFDFFRWPSSTGDILQAWSERRTRHSTGAVFDHLSLACRKGGDHAWERLHSGEFSLAHDFLEVANIFNSYGTNDDYLDAHAWRFTPSSFRLILHDIRQLGLVGLSEVGFYDTAGCEFIIFLGHCEQKIEYTKQMRISLCEEMVKETAESIYAQLIVKKTGIRWRRKFMKIAFAISPSLASGIRHMIHTLDNMRDSLTSRKK